MYPKTMLVRFAEMYRAGALYKEIAKELGIDPSTCTLWRRELGMPKRRRGPRRGIRREA